MAENNKIDLEKLRSIGLLRSGYKNSTLVTYTDDRGSTQTDHFDGRRDAHIMAKAVPMSLKAKERKDE